MNFERNTGKTSKIRIMHVAQAAGGVDRYLQCLLKYMDSERFENIMVCSQYYSAEDYAGIADIFEQIEMQRAIGTADLRAAFKIRELIKKYRPDIVYGHSSKAGALVRMANVGLKNKCVYNPHGWAFNMKGSKKKQIMYAWLERIMAPFCDRVICISVAEKQYALEKKICREDKLSVIFNGVDVEAYEKSERGHVKRADLGIPKDAFVVGMVGRLSPQKAPDIFIKMAGLIRKQVENAHFIMVGDGEQREEVVEYAKKNGCGEFIHVTGWVSNPMDYIELFDIACLLSRWEGFGLAIPEYMMARKPVVATAVDAIPNIVNTGVNGLLIEVDNAEMACDAVMRIKTDDELREHLIECGYKDVHQKYNAKRVSEQHGEIFSRTTIL